MIAEVILVVILVYALIPIDLQVRCSMCWEDRGLGLCCGLLKSARGFLLIEFSAHLIVTCTRTHTHTHARTAQALAQSADAPGDLAQLKIGTGRLLLGALLMAFVVAAGVEETMKLVVARAKCCCCNMCVWVCYCSNLCEGGCAATAAVRVRGCTATSASRM
jgi:hypothetical protein